MELDYDWLARLLQGLGYGVHRAPHTGECAVDCHLGSFDVQVKIVLPDDFPATLPKFHLLERFKYGPLAHVSWGESGRAEICFGASSAFHVDYSYPERVVEASLNRALDVLSKALNDKEYNESELRREFVGVWNLSIQDSENSLLCMAEPPDSFEDLEIRSKDVKLKFGAGNAYIATADNSALNDKHQLVRSARSKSRSNRGKGVLLNLPYLPIPPGPSDTVFDWWLDALSKQPEDLLSGLKTYGRHKRAKEFFIVCRAPIEHGGVWFGLHGARSAKDRVPVHPEYLSGWTLTAIILNAASRENLLPRGGSGLNLSAARVCIIGSGSVGGYIGDLLASSGVGQLEFIDYDSFMLENTHRHYLSSDWLFQNKAFSIRCELQRKYPFVICDHQNARLQSLLPELKSKKYDLIVCATGDQSQERYLNQYLHLEGVDLPVVYTWVEAYGVGGHAVACLPLVAGCLNCLFYDKEMDAGSLYPQIGFIEKDQEILTSHAGCGQEYISYSNIDANQTASIAARLATRILNSELSGSVHVSWRGSDTLANKHNIRLTHRYYRFTRVLEEISFGSEGCETCITNGSAN